MSEAGEPAGGFQSFEELDTPYVNLPLFLAGIMAAIAVVAAGTAIEFVRGLYAPTVVRALFVGVTSGHYLGKAMKKDQKGVVSLLMGGFLTFFVVMVASDTSPAFSILVQGIEIPVVTLTLAAATAFMFLIHLGEAVGDAKVIREYLDLLSEVSGYTPLGLLVLWIIEALVPWVASFQLPAIQITSLKETVLVISVLFNAGFLLNWWESQIKRKL